MNKWIYIGGGAVLLILILFVILPYFKSKQESETRVKDDVYTATIENQGKPTANDYISGISSLVGSVSQFIDVSGIGKGGRSISNSNDVSLNEQISQEINNASPNG